MMNNQLRCMLETAETVTRGLPAYVDELRRRGWRNHVRNDFRGVPALAFRS